MTTPKWVVLSAAILVGGVVAVTFWHGYTPDEAWISFLHGDPHRGGQVFFDKGCTHCHAISGTGGKRASDLGRIVDTQLSLGQLVGVMWNHAPDMWKAINEVGMDFPRLDQGEITDLFAYLYLVRYLDEPGDPERGERLLVEKQCVACHAVSGAVGKIGSDLRQWGAFDNPLLWIQQMWNHGSTMHQAMEEKGIAWPVFKDDEMVDLLSYIRKVSSAPRLSVDFLPANPKEGERLFAEKGCNHCHAIQGRGGARAADLGRAPRFPRTLTRVAGMMWNHSPEMWQAMEAEHIPRPDFSREEMADLVAYLYAVRYFDESGDLDAGKRSFSEKQCTQCHRFEGEGASKKGPDISRWRGRVSPLVMAYVMWRHGPGMYEKMREMGTPWPLFKDREMCDLIAFLNAER